MVHQVAIAHFFRCEVTDNYDEDQCEYVSDPLEN